MNDKDMVDLDQPMTLRMFRKQMAIRAEATLKATVRACNEMRDRIPNPAKSMEQEFIVIGTNPTVLRRVR